MSDEHETEIPGYIVTAVTAKPGMSISRPDPRGPKTTVVKVPAAVRCIANPNHGPVTMGDRPIVIGEVITGPVDLLLHFASMPTLFEALDAVPAEPAKE
jgi:hypothetical protein